MYRCHYTGTLYACIQLMAVMDIFCYSGGTVYLLLDIYVVPPDMFNNNKINKLIILINIQ